MWPTPLSTISLVSFAVFASGCEWMWVETVLSASPAMMVIGTRDAAVARRLLGHRRAQRHQIPGIGDEFARPQQEARRAVSDKVLRHRLRREHAARAGIGEQQAQAAA